MAKLPPCTKCFPPKTKQELEQESSLYNDYDSPISTLPRSSDSLVQLSLFNGFWFPNGAGLGLKILHGTLAARDHFHPLPGDILLSSLPKVSTTWLQALAFATLHRSDENLSSLLPPLTLTNASLPSNTRSMPITISLTSTPSPPLTSSRPTSPTRYCRLLSSDLNHVVKVSTSVETQWTRSYQCGSSSTA